MLETRHRCSKCGRKRRRRFLVYAYAVKQRIREYNSSWCNYPRKDSYLCKEKCIPFKSI